MTYEYIINPETNRKYDLNSKKGMSILNNYLKQVGGSPSRRKLASDHLDKKDEERLSDIKSDYSSQSEDSSRHNSPRHHSPRHHSPRHHSPRHHTPRDESSRDESSRDESSRDESSRDESPRHHSPRDELPRPLSPRDELLRPLSPRDELPRPLSPRHHSPRHESPRHHSPRHESPHRQGLSPYILRSLSKPCREIENESACHRRIDCRVTKNGCRKYERSDLRSHKKRLTTPRFDHLDRRDRQRLSSAHDKIQQLRERDQYLLRDLEKPCQNLGYYDCERRVDCFNDSEGYCRKLHDESRVDRLKPTIQYHEDEDIRRRGRDIESAYYGQSSFAPNLRRQIGVDPGMVPTPTASTVSSDLFV